MIFQSQRLYVRQYTLNDEEAFFILNGDEEIMHYIRPVKTREGSRLFLLENLEFYEQHPGLGRWALLEKATDQFAGTFSLLPLEHTNDVHIGYALLKDHWGKGYAAEIVQAGLIYAFNELKLPSVVAVTYPENIASQKVLLKNNFQPDGYYEEEGKQNLLFRSNRRQM
ncbi:MAG TPA: GNAT family N-acetyltransferase [Chitinophagaceae bacterium]|nr:GNAT family N-acetyltransferase [Chitinophagaceae bacterium]